MNDLNKTTSQESPFEILDVKASANKKEILQHVVLAMKKRQFDTKSIAEAQKTLFNPLLRAVEEFQYFISSYQPKPKVKGGKQKKSSVKKQVTAKLNYAIPPIINFKNE